jgi:hypothetical protein
MSWAVHGNYSFLAWLRVCSYEALTVEDIYLLYSHFKTDDDSIFTCVGTSGEWQQLRVAALRIWV